MKTEMVVRGYVGKDVDFSNPPRGFSVWRTDEFDAKPPQPVSVLLHGENGEVGGLEPWMVEWLESGTPRTWDNVPTRFWAGAHAVDEAIAKAIANILNPEDT